MVANQLHLMDEVGMMAQRLDVIENGQQTLMKGQEYIVRTLNQMMIKLSMNNGKTTKKPPAQKTSSSKGKI